MSTNVEQLISGNKQLNIERIGLQLQVPRQRVNPRAMMSALLLGGDLVSFLIAGLLAIPIHGFFVGKIEFDLFLQTLLYILFSQVAFAMRSLYPGVGVGPVNELRRLTISATSVFVLLAAMTFWLRNPGDYSRMNLALSWGFSLFLVPLGRAVVRSISTRLGLYGEPIVVIGHGDRGKQIVSFLKQNPSVGLRPIVIIDGFGGSEEASDNGIPIAHLEDPTGISSLFTRLGVESAIIMTSEVSSELLKAAEKIERDSFKRLILIPDREQIGGLGLRKYDLGMSFGLEVKRNLFNLWENLIKRITDLILVVAGGFFSLPIITFIAILIRLDSKGPIFYGHTRIGKKGIPFKAWKFRTMVPDADQVLKAYLEANPEMKREWTSTYKLHNDPRVTRVGSILRKLSLDELPQLWNVFRGEMSLVGPRPIVNDEVKFYGDRYDLYTAVTPGITGLWQVSGRNNTTYEERVCLDEYYVRNWSIWMDIYILARTVAVVFKREGAY